MVLADELFAKFLGIRLKLSVSFVAQDTQVHRINVQTLVRIGGGKHAYLVAPANQPVGQRVGVHFQSAGEGFFDRVFEVGYNSDFHS